MIVCTVYTIILKLYLTIVDFQETLNEVSL